MIDNKISLTISEAQKTAVEEARAKLEDAVKTFLIQITKEELKSLPKLGDGRIPFVDKASQYAVTDPEFLPPFADVPEFNTDFQAFKDVREMVRPLEQIVDGLVNSMMVSGSESYHFARNYYQTVQFNAKMGVPGAQTIYEDLKKLYEIKEDDPQPPPPQP